MERHPRCIADRCNASRQIGAKRLPIPDVNMHVDEPGHDDPPVSFDNRRCALGLDLIGRHDPNDPAVCDQDGHFGNQPGMFPFEMEYPDVVQQQAVTVLRARRGCLHRECSKAEKKGSQYIHGIPRCWIGTLAMPP